MSRGRRGHGQGHAHEYQRGRRRAHRRGFHSEFAMEPRQSPLQLVVAGNNDLSVTLLPILTTALQAPRATKATRAT